MSSLTLEGASAWAKIPQLPPEVEQAAAEALIDFLKDVRSTIEKAVDNGQAALEELHEIYDFKRFKPEWMPFILAALGVGEVRITLHKGLVKIEETGVPALWRMQMGENESFVLSRIPLCVRRAALEGDEEIGKIVNAGADVFAAQAIIEELRNGLKDVQWKTIPEDPAFMVELTHQPMSPGDSRALLSTLGTGDIDVEIQGFAKTEIQRTQVKGLWHSRLYNNAGKTLLDAYVTAYIPPEVAAPYESFGDAKAKCTDLIEWMQGDLDRGVIGKKEAKDA